VEEAETSRALLPDPALPLPLSTLNIIFYNVPGPGENTGYLLSAHKNVSSCLASRELAASSEGSSAWLCLWEFAQSSAASCRPGQDRRVPLNTQNDQSTMCHSLLCHLIYTLRQSWESGPITK
jgi:hypothetical protein